MRKVLVLILLISFTSPFIFASNKKLKEVNNDESDSSIYLDPSNKDYYSTSYYQLIDFSYSLNLNKNHFYSLDFMGFSFATDSRFYLGLSLMHLYFNSDFINISVLELNGRFRIFNILNDDKNNILYNFLHFKFRPLSTSYNEIDEFRFTPYFVLGSEVACSISFTTLYIGCDYHYDFFYTERTEFKYYLGLRLGVLTSFLTR